MLEKQVQLKRIYLKLVCQSSLIFKRGHDHLYTVTETRNMIIWIQRTIILFLLCYYMSNVNAKGDVNPLFYAISGIKTYSDYGESTYIFTRIKNCNLWAASGKMFLHKEKASSHWLVTDFYSEPNIDMETCQVSSTKKKNKTNFNLNSGRWNIDLKIDRVILKNQQNSSHPQNIGWKDNYGNAKNVEMFPLGKDSFGIKVVNFHNLGRGGAHPKILTFSQLLFSMF